MKKLLKYIVKTILKWFFLVYPHSTAKKTGNYVNRIYTLWLAREFKFLGKDSHIERPMYLKGGQYMSIQNNFSSLARLRLECWDTYEKDAFTPELTIGNNVCMNYNVHIGCINKINIGNNVLFASNIYITDHHHGYADERHLHIPPAKRPLISKGPVIIEDNVWIGENVSIMPNVTIGKGSVIGANSVVTKSFPRYSVIGGVPAKIIKTLDLKD
jgi:acetyltransferase-like isoleucine patch superfamily enzyme